MIKVGQGEAEVTINERTLILRIDNEALLAAEDAADIDLPTLLQRLKLRRLGAVRAVLFGALQHHQPDIDKAAAATLVFDHLPAIMPALNQALERAFPEAVAQAKAAAAAKAKTSAEGKGDGGSESSASGSKPVSTRKPTGSRRRS